MITTIAGGVGAARMLRCLLAGFPSEDHRAVVNVADDEVLHGLHISPDLDTITYTLAGATDDARGWGLANETWRAMESLQTYCTSSDRRDLGWFNLGDADLGTHLYRTSRLLEGATLEAVTEEISSRWQLSVRLIPATNDQLRTRLRTAEGAELSFQEYFVREQHGVPVAEVVIEGAADAEATPSALQSIMDADVVVIAPSNPIVSIGPVRAIQAVEVALRAARSKTVAISPIIGGAALKGPADRLLRELGHEVSPVGIARIYREIASVLVIDTADADCVAAVEAEGMRCVVTGTIMSEPTVAQTLGATVIQSILGEPSR